jgi:DNA-directed RNA polymerase specialized sigma subunit, sigma24 homolog
MRCARASVVRLSHSMRLAKRLVTSRHRSRSPTRRRRRTNFALRRELARAIETGLAQLPVDQRLVVVLCDLQGLTYEEIAEVTGANLGTIKSRLSRGRARLRDLLREEELLPLRFRHDGEE